MRYSPTGTHIVMERGQNVADGPRRIEVCEAATGVVVATFGAGYNPRWLDATNLVAESPDGLVEIAFDSGFAINYIPANRGQLDANDGVWAVSDLSRTVVDRDPLPIADAREPRISAAGELALRHPNTGVLRIHRGQELGICEDSRWSSETLVWWLGGRVWGRIVPDQPTVELTVPGRACSHPCPFWDGSRLWVGLVLDDGDLWVAMWPDLVQRNGLGYRIGRSDGSGFDWDFRKDAAGSFLHVCYFDPLGKPVYATIDSPAESMLRPPAPEPPPVPPDISWTPDPTRTVDMLEYVKAAATAYVVLANGHGELWMHKSQERPDWGENWDHDRDYIGFREDRSTGTRMVSEVRPKAHSHTNTRRNRLSPEEIVARNAAGENLGDYRTLPLAGYTWRGNRVWMPRHVTGRTTIDFRTDYVWWDLPEFGGVWEVWTGMRVASTIETGYARFNGHEVFARQVYFKNNGDYEANWWGPHGWIGFSAFHVDGSEELAARRIAPPEQRASPLNAPFVPARFTPTYPIYTAPTPQPPAPPKEPDVLPTVNQIPRDQIVRAAEAIDDYLVGNPRLGLPDGLMPDGVTASLPMAVLLDAVCAYLIGEWCPEVCRLGPFPGDAAGWTQRREAGLHHTFRTIERERGEQPPVQPPVQPPGTQPPVTGTLRGPIAVSGRDLSVPDTE